MLQLEREVTGLFYDLLWAQRNVELLQENVNINEKFLEAASYKFNQGFGSKLDVVKGQVEIAHAKRLLNSAEQEFLTTENKLRILLKIAFTQPLALKGDLTLSVVQAPQGLDSLLSTAYQSHPSLLLEQHRLKEAQYTVQLAELSSKPNFNLGLSGGIEDLERAATLSISIPLAIWDTKEGAKSEAQFQQKSVEYSLENIRTNISKQVTSAFQAYQAATQAAKLFEDTLLREAKEAAEMAKKAFETSGFRFLDLIDAQRTYLDARLEYLNSLRALRHAEIDLQTSTGIPIYGGQQ
jgi:cobalt-zinc-cadmium efflux system outer membrane protein